MKFLSRLLTAITIAGILILGRASAVSAHEGEVHIGTMEIPVIVVWIGGGVLVAFFLFFFISWYLSSSARKNTQPEKKEEKQ